MLRPATPEDAHAAWRLMAEGFASYAAFGVEGYRGIQDTPEDMAARLAQDHAWAVVAEEDGVVVAVGGFEAAREGARDGPRVPGLAHVFAIFVTEARWGSGIAAQVLAAVVAEIRRRGYEQARLFTPAPHARARRFYAREGWHEVGEPFGVEALGLDMLELRRAV
jgi:GNAT superfamily N-acetyltransferase